MIKTIEVEGKNKSVMVLRETDEQIVYISLRHIDRIDYDRMVELSASTDEDLLDSMRTTRFDNGMLGLNLYKDLIMTVKKRKEKEPEPTVLTEGPSTGEKTEIKTEVTPVEDKPKPIKRRPGRPPKAKKPTDTK